MPPKSSCPPKSSRTSSSGSRWARRIPADRARPKARQAAAYTWKKKEIDIGKAAKVLGLSSRRGPDAAAGEERRLARRSDIDGFVARRRSRRRDCSPSRTPETRPAPAPVTFDLDRTAARRPTRSRRLRRRRHEIAECASRESQRHSARLGALRRALGPALARRRPLRRVERPATRTSPTRTPGATATTSSTRSTRDKPYDQFVREQIAGDLLPHDGRPQNARAAHRHRLPGHRPEGARRARPADSSQMDIVDEQIDTVGQAFLGLTVACARCHDHKFDPDPQTDYYAGRHLPQHRDALRHRRASTPPRRRLIELLAGAAPRLRWPEDLHIRAIVARWRRKSERPTAQRRQRGAAVGGRGWRRRQGPAPPSSAFSDALERETSRRELRQVRRRRKAPHPGDGRARPAKSRHETPDL